MLKREYWEHFSRFNRLIGVLCDFRRGKSPRFRGSSFALSHNVNALPVGVSQAWKLMGSVLLTACDKIINVSYNES